MKHEVECKTSIPLPLVCIMELEAVAILERTVKDYRHKLGAKHHLTVEVQQRIDDLQMRVSGKICNEEQQAEVPGGRKVREKIEKTLTKMKEERKKEGKETR
ncbi:hypothetical protein AOXY_G33214 [Acipenser oxyrinchus oxyrinchus]|uniref:Uncharacterized protein n=1 Tax=Acipenser oxyrinchus oxyrinchus TaxID=40147 RepID=A0AAD8FRV1_ACIOX|nr:hypothetical protein AOXY_G33214 [Acipenser oxyrinchus oxyrinchus]